MGNFVKNNIIYIHGDFDNTISMNVIPDLNLMIEQEKAKKSGKIIFDIDSNGGITTYLFHLLALVEYAKSLGIIVETRVLAKAYSCGSLLACAGSRGHRIVGEFARHMCHVGRGGGVVQDEIELDRLHNLVKSHFKIIKGIYKKYANIPDLDVALKNDNFCVSGKKIITYGLADKFL